MVEKCAEDYLKIFETIHLEHEVNPIYGNIEDILARLDEFETILSNIKSERIGVTVNSVSALNDFKAQFKAFCTSVDKLEYFVNIIASNVIAMERTVDIAEVELNVPNYSIKSLILKPLMNKTTKTTDTDASSKRSNLKDGAYQETDIFKTDQYF